MEHKTVIRRAVLAGTTPRITFQLVDEDGIGFIPDTLTLSIYDVSVPERIASLFTRDPWPYLGYPDVTQAIVNERNDVDVLSAVEAGGEVEYYLEAADTEVTVPSALVPSRIFRRLLFTWTWDIGNSPDTTKVGKHEIILPIAPDREIEAT